MKSVYSAIITPSDYSVPIGNFLASVNDLLDYDLQNVIDSDMVGITIHNQVNQDDKLIGISFSRRDQLSGDVM